MIDLRLEGPDPTALVPDEDGLLIVRLWYRAGHDSTVTGLPASSKSDGLWIDVGEDVLVVQPLLMFAKDPPAAEDIVVPIAERVLERLPVAPSGTEAP